MSDNEIKVIGVGASAGGLEALQALLEPAKKDYPAAIVIIQHLAPDHATMTAELLGRHTSLEVVRVTENVELRTGTVFVIEPKTTLTLSENTLVVAPRDDTTRLLRQIDRFFVSLAEQRGAKADAVVLSGTGSDGTDGARAVKEAGGFVVVQAPDTARFDGMPRSVIGARCHDLCLAPGEILHRLESLAVQTPADLLEGTTTLENVLTVLAEQEDVDLSGYREPTVRRRVERRVALAQLNTVQEYVLLLRNSAAERLALVSDLFIGVTRFFRDPEGYDSLTETLRAIPESEEPFRVWVCGCSTGEEAYSLGMILWRLFLDRRVPREFKLFATDVSEAAVRQASRGLFSEAVMRDVSPDLQARFFRRSDDGQFVCETGLRNRIVFSHHDALRDPPFSRLDLVVCRNMLIYLQEEAQAQLMGGFSFSLRENGILWLGPSESIAEKTKEFTPIDTKWRIFRNSSPRRGPRLDWKMRSPQPQENLRASRASIGLRKGDLDWKKLHDTISQGFLPSHYLVNDQFRILYQHGSFARELLRFPEGEVTTDVRSLVPASLKPALESLFAEVETGDEAEVSGVRVPELDQVLSIRVRQISNSPVLNAIFILEEGRERPLTPVQALNLADIEANLQRRVESLEIELQVSRESLQNTVEELESSNEELQATNEELLASNEELQSVNEELQSVNEELHTVNTEHQAKIVQLGLLNADLDTLLATVDHGVLFLDGELRVRRFNPRVKDFIAVMESDVGRPFGHFTHKLDDFPFLDICSRCLRDRKTYEQVVPITHESRILLIRMAPLLNESAQTGVVISITDVTTVEQLRQSHSRFLAALDNVDLPLALLSVEGEIEYANQSLADLAGRDGRYLVGTMARDLVDAESMTTWQEAVTQVSQGSSWEGYLRLSRPDGSQTSEVVRLTPSLSAHGVVTGMVRLTLVNTRSGSSALSSDSGSFFFSSKVPKDSELGGVSLVVKQLATPGKVRERALLFVAEESRQEVADAVKKCETVISESGTESDSHEVHFDVRLGGNQCYRVHAEFKVRDSIVLGIVRGIEWRLDQQGIEEAAL